MGKEMEDRLRTVAQNLSHPDTPKVTPVARPGRKRKVAVLIVASVIGLAGIIWGTLLWPHNKVMPVQDPFPASIKSIAQFPLYYPTRLPPGFKLEASSLSVTKNAATYQVVYDKGKKKLLFSLQPNPKNFDFKKFYARIFKGGLGIETPRGKGKIGQLEGMDAASFQTEKTWVIITAPLGIEPEPLAAIARSLQQSSP